MKKLVVFNITSLFIALLLLGAMVSFSLKPKIYDIKNFGAKGDSITINTKAIQKAIDKCSKNGGGIVVIKEGVYSSGTILLKDNVTLQIDKSAKLLGSANPQDYQSIDTFVDATGQKRGTCLIGAMGAKNIGISGSGSIDGNGTAFLPENLFIKKKALGISGEDRFGGNRPFLLRFVKSTQITLKNIHLREAAAWACHFFQSSNILVDNVSIYNHANQNNDGIDLDSSHDIIIKNCNINSGDDAICIKSTSPLPTYNVKVSNCTLKSDWGAIKFGTESMGDFYNIDIRDCKIEDTKGGGIKILSVDGANIHDVLIENIEMNHVDMPIFVRLGERLRTYRTTDKQAVGSIHNVRIKNIKATTRGLDSSRVSPPSGILITGTPKHKIGALTLENITIDLPGGGKLSDLFEVPEDETRYPEFSFFNVLPAYGMYARHIKELKISSLDIKTETIDLRPETLIID
ncbi:glycoside hydrolase family 28 [Cellulophaga algicola DSM 14237]|uniref:Glycoside hydrolase family 28 n=1 Tax=Cellulophaga algicola (strain DSM 14237 / IC166 / ACAM 630) TaxID=688270 RepID=E6X8Z3_CELAD|nr:MULTISPECIES: glycosyl hydrolase family 28 protein [Cellulophaga]ADV49764.1 glycoside hydrolase family 28 [Cellulophaga algicola DSM 14237]